MALVALRTDSSFAVRLLLMLPAPVNDSAGPTTVNFSSRRSTLTPIPWGVQQTMRQRGPGWSEKDNDLVPHGQVRGRRELDRVDSSGAVPLGISPATPDFSVRARRACEEGHRPSRPEVESPW